MRGASGRECTLRATCVQKTLCSDLSQIKYVRWNSAFMEHGAFIGFRGLPTKAGRAMEIGIGNALLHVYHPSFALRNDSAYERRRVSDGIDVQVIGSPRAPWGR